MKKITGILKLIRFELPFSAGVCVVLGQILAIGEFASIITSTLGFVSVFFISASILVFNDYFDVESDKINAPERPIPSKIVSPNEALMLAIFLLVFGLWLSYLLSISALLISFLLTIIGFLYNRFFKKSGLPGNLMVSFSVGMTFIYGGVSVGYPFNKVVLFFALIAALIDLGEEIAADSMDIEGDRLINSNSVAIRYGKFTALKISGFIFLMVILISFIPFIMSWFPLIYLVPIGIMDLSIAYPAYRLIYDRNKEERRYIRWIYLGATFGLIVFLIFRVIGI